MILDVSQAAMSEYSPINTGFVEIASPNQFVPLYLAKYVPNGTPESLRNRTSLTISEIPIPLSRNELSDWRRFRAEASWVNLKRKFLTQVLQNQLVLPNPTAYTFNPLHTRSASVTPNIQNTFFGRAHGTLIPHLRNVFAGFGVVGTYDHRQLQAVRSGLYQIQDHGPQQFVYQQSLDIDVMMLIKAKQVNRLRAAMLLHRPWDVPFSDLKILRTTRNLPASHHATPVLRDLQTYMMKHDITMDMVSKEEMLSYLVTPNAQKTKEQYLQDALQARKMPEIDIFLK